MPALDMVVSLSSFDLPDVAESQPTILANSPCQTRRQSATVSSGRTQAAFASDEGYAIGTSVAPFQEYRSRGCRRARKLSWPCAWLPSWQHVAVPSSLKSFTWTNRFRSSQATPANTNKSVGRAFGHVSDCPAHTYPCRHLFWPNVGKSPRSHAKKSVGEQRSLIYPNSVHKLLIGESEWNLDHYSPLRSSELVLLAVRQHPRHSPSCQNPSTTSSAMQRSVGQCASRQARLRRPARLTIRTCQLVNRAARRAPNWTGVSLLRPMPIRSGLCAFQSRAIHPLIDSQILNAQIQTQPEGEATRFLLASALGLTPTQAYGCAHPFTGGTPC